MIFKYCADMKDAPLSDLLSRASINTENQLMDLSGSNCQDCPDTVRSTRAYIVIYQGGPIDNGTHVPGPVAQSIEENDYNIA